MFGVDYLFMSDNTCCQNTLRHRILNSTKLLFKYVACTIFEPRVQRKRIFLSSKNKNKIQLEHMYIQYIQL